MTDTQEIARIRAALAAGPTPGPWAHIGMGDVVALVGPDYELHPDHLHHICDAAGMCDVNPDYIAACNPSAMTALLAHMDAQAAEIERLQADAARIEALEKLHQSHMTTDMHLGRYNSAAIYQRTGIGSNINMKGHGKTVREAIDAIKEQP